MSQKSIKIRPNYTAVFSDVRIEEADPTLKFQDSSATDGEVSASISVALTDTGTGTEDADMSFNVKIAGTLTEAMKIDADGFIEFNLPVAMTADDFLIKDAGTASLNFKDDDCTDDDINAAIGVNCTDTGTGAEDADITVAQQIAGTSTDVLLLDADGDCEIYKNVTVKHATAPGLQFKDDNATDDDINASISVNLTDTGAAAEDADVSFKVQIAGTLTEVMKIDADGSIEMNLPVLLSGDDLTIKDAGSAALNFKDDDCTDDDINAAIEVNCTDTGTGAEDADVSIKVQIAGTLTEVVNIDADGDILLAGKNLIVKHATAPALYFKDDDATDDDINAQIDVNLTATGSGAEDGDISIKSQVAGVLTEWLLFDASATNIEVGSTLGIGKTSFTATFNGGTPVGALSVVARKIGKLVTLEIPTGTTADPDAQVLSSGATDIPSALRPAADLEFPAFVTDNNVKVAGKLKVTSAGQLIFSVGAADGSFTNAATAGWPRIAVTYTLA